MKRHARILLLGLITAWLTSLGVAHAQTWSEDFEGPFVLFNWSIENGVWEFGVPTSGPTANGSGIRAHSGTNCAATILAGNYPEPANTRLIRETEFTVPASNQYPRLVFWQYFSLNLGDYALVEIKEVGSNTWVQLGWEGSTGGPNWTRESVDLRGYAGKTVQIAFRFYAMNHPTRGDSDVAEGWYLDDVGVVTGTPAFNNPEGFESGMGDWYAEGGLWEAGRPGVGPSAAHGGVNCVGTVLSNNYPESVGGSGVPGDYSLNGVSSRLISPEFLVPAINPRLIFWQWYSFGLADSGVVQVRIVGSASWTTISTTNINTSGGVWSPVNLNLAAYSGQRIQIAFSFTASNDPGNGSNDTGPGWYIDDVNLYNYVAPLVITQPPTNQTVVVGSNTTFNVTVSGTAPFSYQWRFGGANLANETNQLLALVHVQTNQAGAYDVVIGNASGSVTSQPPAILTVVAPPSITGLSMLPSSPVSEGANVTFCVGASGSAPLSYQWRLNGGSISGATLPCYTLTNVQLFQAGAYSVAVSNWAGGVISGDLTLAVLPDWHTNSVGATGDGSYSLSNGIFTVNGGGEDIEGTKDDFFFVHKPLTGDGQIVARVLGMLPTDPNSEPGVMLRDGTNSGARHIFLPLKYTRKVAFRRRLVENDYSRDNAIGGTNWTWLRLARMGDTFVGHASTNGTDWALIWWTTLANMPTSLEAGLAVTAHKNGTIATAQFDQVATGPLTPLTGTMRQALPLGGESGGMSEFQRVGGFKLLVEGAVGATYNIIVSPTVDAPFASWSVLGTVTNTYGVVTFLDQQALTHGHQFYRGQRRGP